MSVEDQLCPICEFDGIDRERRSDGSIIKCRRCGSFRITGTAEAIARANEYEPSVIANLSGWVSEHQGTVIDSRDLEQLLSLRSLSVGERAMRLLHRLAAVYPRVGEMFQFSFPDAASNEPFWIAASWSESIHEVQYLMVDYLHQTLGAIDGDISRTMGGGLYLMQGRITPRGHELLEQMRHGNPQSAIGFCAMWFAEEVKPLWTDAIEPAIRNAGYDPKRIDQHEHVNRIDDEIVAMIRRSRFVVADFTGQRGGVYFEAGFAIGLGLPVIWVCREDQLKELHFDTRQYNFLTWQPGSFPDLAKRLQARIEAILGRGPL